MTTYKVWNGSAWVYIDSQNYDSRYIKLTTKGTNDGVASLDSSGHIPMIQLPSSLTGAVSYQGTFAPSGGTAPTPAAKGYYYVASDAGTISATSFATGDWLIYTDGSAWNKLQNSSSSIMWSNISNKPASYTPDVHSNDSHSELYITTTGVTFEALNGNSDVGTGATQVAAGNHTHSDLQPIDPDLTAIAALAGTAGLLRKSAANTWELDTNTYITSLSTAPNATNWDSFARPSAVGNALKVLRLNATATAFEFATSGSGVGTFLELTDTPSVYTGQAGKYVKVNVGETALEFATVSGGAGTWGSITGDIDDQTDLLTVLNGKQASDADLTAIAALVGTSGYLKKIAENTWELDVNSFATTGHNHSGTYQPLDSELTLLAALSLSGNNSKYIRLNATADAFEFATVDALPSQTGNSGKYLTTDGSSASWGTVPAVSTYNVQRSIEGVVYETTLMYWVAPATCTINTVTMALSSNPTATGSYCKVQVMKNGLLETNSIFSADTPMQVTELTSPTNSVYTASGTLDSNQTTLVAGDVIQFRVNQADTGSADLLISMMVNTTNAMATMDGGSA